MDQADFVKYLKQYATKDYYLGIEEEEAPVIYISSPSMKVILAKTASHGSLMIGL